MFNRFLDKDRVLPTEYLVEAFFEFLAKLNGNSYFHKVEIETINDNRIHSLDLEKKKPLTAVVDFEQVFSETIHDHKYTKLRIIFPQNRDISEFEISRMKPWITKERKEMFLKEIHTGMREFRKIIKKYQDEEKSYNECNYEEQGS